MLRTTLIYLSRQKQLRHWMETSSAARRLTSRFVAGQTLEEGIAVLKRLNRDCYLGTLDHLGEAVVSGEEAREARDAYLAALGRIGNEDVKATVSIKLSQFGVDIDEGLARENVRQVAEAALAARTGVEIDMEEASSVDRTLSIVTELHERYGNVRGVIQAYLRRSENDIRRLCELHIPVRLCKGAYQEPEDIAFAEKSEVDRNYLRLTALLFAEGVNPGIATHDPRMVGGALAACEEHHQGREGFEFQMLYGIRRDLQRKLISEGYRVRVYVPFGNAWYPYFMRRLAERPANLLFLARNLVRK